MKQKVYLEGMHCQMCAGRVTRVFSALEGVESCEVHLAENCAVLELCEPIAEEVLRETVEDLGFDFVRAE